MMDVDGWRHLPMPLHRSTQAEQGFEAMLKVTSELRQEQEEEARLMEKMRDQRQALQQSDGRCVKAVVVVAW